jgi:hypothetical protein
LYLPVPMMRRDLYVRPAIVSGLSSGGATGALPPPMKCTISSLSPSPTVTSAYLERGTISRLRSTATLAGSCPSADSRSDRLKAPFRWRNSPLMVTAMLINLFPLGGFANALGPL